MLKVFYCLLVKYNDQFQLEDSRENISSILKGFFYLYRLQKQGIQCYKMCSFWHRLDQNCSKCVEK